MIAGWSSWRFLSSSWALGPKATPAAIIPNMAIKNSDVIAQAMVRLHLRKACTLPRKARRANAIFISLHYNDEAVARAFAVGPRYILIPVGTPPLVTLV